MTKASPKSSEDVGNTVHTSAQVHFSTTTQSAADLECMQVEAKQCIKRMRRRLERWELPHLRELSARLATELEEMTARAEAAETEASMWARDAQNAHDLLNEWVNDQPGTAIGLTIDGTVHLLQGGAA